MKSKLSKPYKKMLKLFTFKHIRIGFRPLKPKTKTSKRGGCLSKLRSALRSIVRRKTERDDRATELTSFSECRHDHNNKAPCPSPITPPYIRMEGGSHNEEYDEACRSFRSYLIDMIVEEGRMRDLVDVEEVINCWKNLRSPVFVDLVCRFYGDLCRDLFSSSSEEDGVNAK